MRLATRRSTLTNYSPEPVKSSPKTHRLIIHLEQHQREWLDRQSKYTPMAALVRRLIDEAIEAETHESHA